MFTTDDIMLALKYDDSEYETVNRFHKGAVAFLRNTDAYHEGNELTDVVVTTIVGFWMDNREASYTEYRSVGDFPIGLQPLITQLKYLAVNDNGATT